MALTPEDVRNKLFTTVRLREGYDQTEVDEFLDEVEAELLRLLKENDRLRGGADGTAAEEQKAPARPAAAAPEGSPDSAVAAPVTPARQAPREVVVRTTGEVSTAAAKVLELAQQTADQYLGEAREEADRLVTDATAEAERLSTEARTKADAVDRQTHERTTALESQLAEQRKTVLDRLQQEKRRLESEVESLRSFEREYRGRLRTFLEGQLEQLAARTEGDTPLAPAGGPPSPAERGDPSSLGAQAAGSGPTAANASVEEPSAPETAAASGDEPVGGAAQDRSGSPDAASTSGPAGQAEPGRAGAGAPSVPSSRRSALGRILDEEERNTSS